MGDRTAVQAGEAELPLEILLRRKRQRHQDTDLGDAYRQPSVDGYAERIDAEMELLGACDNGKNHTHVLCGLPQPV